jgi:hypothetical protein
MIDTAEDIGNDSFKVTLSDGTVMIVPKDPLNADYVRLQAWIEAGGKLA